MNVFNVNVLADILSPIVNPGRKLVRFVKWLGVALLSFIAFGAVALFVLLAVVPRYILPDLLNSAGIGFSYDRADFDPISLRMDFAQVRVSYRGQNVLISQHILFDIGLSMHGATLDINFIRPIFTVLRSEAGSFVLPFPETTHKTAHNLMVLRSIKVDQGTITYQDRRTGLTIDIRNFQLDMTSGPPSILTLRSPTCRITYGRRAIESKVRLQAILDDPVRIQLMEWMSDGLTLSMKNQVLNTKALAFDVDGRLDAAKFLQATGIRSLVDAQVDFTADFDLPARRMRVTAHSNRLRTASIQMDDINGECAIAADGTSDAHITTRIAGGRAGLQMATDHGKTRADIQLEQVDPRQLPPVSKRLPITPATTISGKVRLDWRGLLQPVDLRGHTELVLNSSHAAKGEMPLTGQFSADYEKGALQIRPSRVHVGSAAAVDFEGSLAPKAIDLQFSAGVVEIKQFLKDTIGDRIALPEKLSGTASLVGRLSGDGSSLAARFESPLIHLGGKEISNISSSIDVAGRTIEISDFQCRTLGGTLSGHGSIREKDYSAYLRGESLHLSTLSPIFTEGICGFTASGNGPLGDLSIAGQLAVDGAATSMTIPESFGGTFELNKRRLLAEFQSSDENLGGSFQMDLATPYPVHLMTSFINIPAAEILTRYKGKTDFQATATGFLDISAELLAPHCLEGRIVLNDVDLRFDEFGLNNKDDIVVSLSPDFVDFHHLTMEGMRKHFSVRGVLPLAEGQPADFHLEGLLDLEVLEILIPGMRASGTLGGEASFIGVRPAIETSGLLFLDHVSLTYPRIPFSTKEVTGNLVLKGNEVHLQEIHGILDQGQFSVSGVIPLDALPITSTRSPRNIDLHLTVQSFGTSNFTRLIPEKLRRAFSATADADVTFGGNFRSLNTVTIDGAITNTKITLLGKPFPGQSAPYRIIKRGDSIELTDVHLAGGGIDISGTARLNFGEGKPPYIHSSVKADIQNQFLQSYLPMAKFGGSTSLSVNVEGVLAKPAIEGTLMVKDSSAGFSMQRIDLTAANGKIDFTGRTAHATGVAMLNGGAVELDGSATIDGIKLTGLLVDTSFNGCGTFIPDGLQGKFEGRTTLSLLRNGRYLLDGDLWLRDGIFRRNFRLGQELLASFPSKQGKPTARPFPDLMLDLRLSPVDLINVKNNIADIRLKGDVALRGTVGKPRLYGQIDASPNGIFRFQGRDYKVETCTLSFEGNEGFDPHLNIQATVNVTVNLQRRNAFASSSGTSHVIKATLTGKLSNTNLNLQDIQGQPPLSEIEAASLLLTGQIVGEGSTTSKDALKNQMARFIGGSVGNTFLPVIGRKLGIDQFDIQPNYISNETDTPTARAIIGKDLGGGFFFTYSPDLSNSQRYLWMLDYQMGRNVALRAGRQDDASYQGRVSHNLSFNLFAGRKLEPAISLKSAPPQRMETGKQYITEITIDGLKATDPGIVLRQLTFKAGDVLDYNQIFQSQRLLYGLNLFRSVRIYPERIPGHDGLVIIRVALMEQNVYQFFYGLRYNTEGKIAGVVNTQNPEGFDGELEVHNINVLGKGIDAGLYTRQSKPERNYRLTMAFPYFSKRKISTTVLVYKKDLTQELPIGTFLSHIPGASLLVERNLTKKISLQYFMNYKRTTYIEINPINHLPVSQYTFTRDRLGMTLVGDFRDDRLNAKKGIFCSTTLEYQPRLLGADLRLFKTFSQVRFYYTLFNKLTLAASSGIGVIDTFGQALYDGDAFFVGGSSSVRSYQEDNLGPRDPYSLDPNQPWGGRAVVVYNQEARFPLHSITKRIKLGGVLFHDAGNVFRDIADFKPFDVRHAVGFGLRFDTPYSLFRLDFGVTVKPHPGEDRQRLTFGIGQMF